MKQTILAQELSIYVGEDDQSHGAPLYAVVAERLKDTGVAGVTVLKGIEGYGTHGKLHSTRLEILFQGLPIVVQAIDIPERITLALAAIDEILTEALVTVKEVTAIRYIKDPKS